jgi:hypothetical protein
MQATKAARSVMREFGRDSYSIYTNKYDTCRTVKCYAGRDPEQLVSAIQAEMIRLGHDKVTVMVRDNTAARQGLLGRAWGPKDSIIVRIPN